MRSAHTYLYHRSSSCRRLSLETLMIFIMWYIKTV